MSRGKLQVEFSIYHGFCWTRSRFQSKKRKRDNRLLFFYSAQNSIKLKTQPVSDYIKIFQIGLPTLRKVHESDIILGDLAGLCQVLNFLIFHKFSVFYLCNQKWEYCGSKKDTWPIYKSNFWNKILLKNSPKRFSSKRCFTSSDTVVNFYTLSYFF